MINILKVTYSFRHLNRLSALSMLDKPTLLKSYSINAQLLLSRKGQNKERSNSERKI